MEKIGLGRRPGFVPTTMSWRVIAHRPSQAAPRPTRGALGTDSAVRTRVSIVLLDLDVAVNRLHVFGLTRIDNCRETDTCRGRAACGRVDLLNGLPGPVSGGMCVTARTSSVWPRKVSRLNPDSLMNILFPGDCSMDSDIGPLAWLSTLAAPFFVPSRRDASPRKLR